MQSEAHYQQKVLSFSYEEYVKRGKTIENMIIDKYVVYNRIGEGSNGMVYKGMDDRSKKQVAVKLMDIRQINAEKSPIVRAIKQRLCQSEPRLMFQCNSPNLIKCLDVYRNDDLKVLILEYCNGPTLQRQINQKRRIPQKQAIEIIKHLIVGLMELHRHNIIHRDLKAENIMSHNGTYKIIDFGFSKKLILAQQNSEVKGTALGTITTMAPEVMKKLPYGLKADIWSLGVIYFQMIYGVYPYDSLTAATLYAEIKSKKLFESPKPPVIGGFCPSKESYDFIKFMIVFQTSERPNWRQVSEHPLIKNKNEEVNERFIQQVDVNVDPRLAEWDEAKQSLASSVTSALEEKSQSKKIAEKKSEEKTIQILSFKQPQKKEPQKPKPQKPPKQQKQKPKFKIDLSEDTKKKQNKQEQKERQRSEQVEQLRREMEQKRKVEKQSQARREEEKRRQVEKQIVVRELDAQQISKKRKQQNVEQSEEYEFTQRSHLECLKTQFIYRQIINPLYTTKYLNEEDRNTVQFLYLLLARCFSNMSPIQYQLEHRIKNKDIIKNLNDQITPLYNQVKSKFLEFSEKLTKTQNKLGSIIGDFFKKKIDKSNFSEKDNFLTGIEVINYSKDQQINYTFKYYTAHIQKKIEGISNLSNVVKRLNKYLEINRLTRKDLDTKKKEFTVAVREIIN